MLCKAMFIRPAGHADLVRQVNLSSKNSLVLRATISPLASLFKDSTFAKLIFQRK